MDTKEKFIECILNYKNTINPIIDDLKGFEILMNLREGYAFRTSATLAIYYSNLRENEGIKEDNIKIYNPKELEFAFEPLNNPICKYFRVDYKHLSRCELCDKLIALKYFKGEWKTPKLYHCFLQLWDMAFPIYLDKDKIIGVLFSGQDIVMRGSIHWPTALQEIYNDYVELNPSDISRVKTDEKSNQVEDIKKAIRKEVVEKKYQDIILEKLDEIISEQQADFSVSTERLIEHFKGFMDFGTMVEGLLQVAYDFKKEATSREMMQALSASLAQLDILNKKTWSDDCLDIFTEFKRLWPFKFIKVYSRYRSNFYTIIPFPQKKNHTFPVSIISDTIPVDQIISLHHIVKLVEILIQQSNDLVTFKNITLLIQMLEKGPGYEKPEVTLMKLGFIIRSLETDGLFSNNYTRGNLILLTQAMHDYKKIKAVSLISKTKTMLDNYKDMNDIKNIKDSLNEEIKLLEKDISTDETFEDFETLKLLEKILKKGENKGHLLAIFTNMRQLIQIFENMRKYKQSYITYRNFNLLVKLLIGLNPMQAFQNLIDLYKMLDKYVDINSPFILNHLVALVNLIKQKGKTTKCIDTLSNIRETYNQFSIVLNLGNKNILLYRSENQKEMSMYSSLIAIKGDIDVTNFKIIESGCRTIAMHIDAASLSFRLQEQQEEYKESVGMIAHSFRTPLQRLLFYLKAVERLAKGDKEITEFLQEAKIGLIEAKEDTTYLLGEAIRKVEYFNIMALLDDAIYNVQPIALDHPCNLIIKKEDWPKSVSVKANRYEIKRGLINLLDNAIKYSYHGKIINNKIVDAEVILHVKKLHNNICISIKNYGIGIPPEDIKKIQQVGQRASVLDKKFKKREGTGWGLYVAMQTFNKYGGYIEIDSYPSDQGYRSEDEKCHRYYTIVDAYLPMKTIGGSNYE